MLPGLLERKFAEFPKALLDAHGKDLTVVVDDTPTASGTSTPIPKAAPKLGAAAKGTAKTTVINTATVKVSSRFMASADDLFSLLTDEQRIPVWSKAPAKVSCLSFSLHQSGQVIEQIFDDCTRSTEQARSGISVFTILQWSYGGIRRSRTTYKNSTKVETRRR